MKIQGKCVITFFFNFVQSYTILQKRDKYYIMHTQVTVLRNIWLFVRYFHIYVSAQVGSVTVMPKNFVIQNTFIKSCIVKSILNIRASSWEHILFTYIWLFCKKCMTIAWRITPQSSIENRCHTRDSTQIHPSLTGQIHGRHNVLYTTLKHRNFLGFYLMDFDKNLEIVHQHPKDSPTRWTTSYT